MTGACVGHYGDDQGISHCMVVVPWWIVVGMIGVAIIALIVVSGRRS